MKKLFTLLLIFTVSLAFADGITEIKEGGEIVGYKVEITLTPEEYKAFTYVAYSPWEWIKNLVSNRARQGMDSIVEKYSDKNYRKIGKVEKESIVKNAVIKTAKQRHDEAEAKRKEKEK